MSSVDVALSHEQWQGLGQLGELVSQINQLLEGPLGTIITGYAAEGTAWVPEGMAAALHEVLELLVALHEDGILRKMRIMSHLVAPVLTRENIDAAMTALIAVTEKGSMEGLQEAIRDVRRQSVQTLGRQGGWGGLLRMMKDPDVQAGLHFMAALAGKVANTLKTSKS